MMRSINTAISRVENTRSFRPANLFPLLAFAVFGTLMAGHIQTLDGRALWQSFTNVGWLQWGAVAGFTILSFRAVGTYDVLVHKTLGTNTSKKDAKRSGILAIAVSQTVGFGALSGAAVRWRCLPNLKPSVVVRLSAVVSLSFLAALAVVGGLVIPLSGLMVVQPTWLLFGIFAVACLVILSRLAVKQRWIPKPISPSLLASLLGATFLDTAFAAAALWVLWPDPVSFHLVFAAYLIALAAGLVSNCPGGLGAFDLTLLGLLQTTDANQATAAILAFRMVYYVIPACLAFCLLLRPKIKNSTAQNFDTHTDHGENTLALQSAKVRLLQNTPTLTLPCWGKGVVYGDLPHPKDLVNMPLYKCGKRQAYIARAQGWAVMRCAQEALIDLPTWSLQGPKKRQLRRALKSFSMSDLHIRPVTPDDDLRHVATAWTASHGREKGLSMGRFEPSYLDQQKVFAAFKGATSIAFVSFHVTERKWTLDLMRHVDAVPKGTMHALISAAIAAAIEDEVTTLSLAAVPNPDAKMLGAQIALSKSAGLRRFKSSFAPHWSPRYICARNLVSLTITMATLAWSIHRPPPLTNPAQPNDEDYSFAPRSRACECVPSL